MSEVGSEDDNDSTENEGAHYTARGPWLKAHIPLEANIPAVSMRLPDATSLLGEWRDQNANGASIPRSMAAYNY